MRILANVREALGDEVIRGYLVRLRQPFWHLHDDSNRHRCQRGQLLQCDCEPVASDDSRMDSACDFTELVQRRRDLAPGAVDSALRRGVTWKVALEQAELERQSHKTL